jgi:predicted adenine nucleotide alpha hydrolase (AANH) superfamily ATPase
MIANKLILSSCCAPCSCGAICELIAMKEAGFIGDFIVMFYNPNIFPESEYKKRLDQQMEFCKKMDVKWLAEEWHHDAWLECMKGLEEFPEGSERCLNCFKFRFAHTIERAKELGFDAVASVFGVSRHKSQGQVDAAAMMAIQDVGDGKVKYVPIGWNEKIRSETNKENNFYRQNYCGCEVSMEAAKSKKSYKL